MSRLSWSLLRGRRLTIAGPFVALAMAVAFAVASGQLMAAAISAPGPGRFTAADAVVRATAQVRPAGADGPIEIAPSPRLPRAAIARVRQAPGVTAAVGDLSFPVGLTPAPRLAAGGRLRAHGWASAALAAARLEAGRAPRAAEDVVLGAGTGAAVGDRVLLAAAGGTRRLRVSGLVSGALGSGGQSPVLLRDDVAARLSGDAATVNAIAVRGASPAALARALGPRFDVRDRAHAAQADPGDGRIAQREAIVAIFGTLAGMAGAVALFVVSGTFALSMAQRRREHAVLRALGASPARIRAIVAREALLISLLGAAAGLVAAPPLADAIVALLRSHGTVPGGFAPASSWVPVAGGTAMAVVIAQLAVLAAARRAGRVAPAEALRDATADPARLGAGRVLLGVLALGGGGAMAFVFTGHWAADLSVLTGMVLAAGAGALGPWLVGRPAALLARPLRALGGPGLLAGTALSAHPRRTATLAAPVVFVAMLAGTQGVVQTSRTTQAEDQTAARVRADAILTGRGDAPLPPGARAALAATPGVTAVQASVATAVYPLGEGLGEDAPWPAVGLDDGAALDLDVRAGRRDGRGVAISAVFADAGHLRVGDRFAATLADGTTARLPVAAIYRRSAGFGDVVLPAAFARRHAAVPADQALYLSGPRALSVAQRFASAHPGTQALSPRRFRDGVRVHGEDDRWGVWLVIALTGAFSGLALVNAAAMATAARDRELATVRVLGGTTRQALATVLIEQLATVLAALGCGAAIVLVALHGVPIGADGVPLSLPLGAGATIVGACALLGAVAGLVSTVLTARVSPLTALRTRE